MPLKQLYFKSFNHRIQLLVFLSFIYFVNILFNVMYIEWALGPRATHHLMYICGLEERM